MSSYVRGKRVPGICDRCGMQYLLKTLKSEFIRGSRVGNRVCESCWDADHPQNFQGKVKVYDPQSVRDPRPEYLPPEED